jgi:hypothetical protein
MNEGYANVLLVDIHRQSFHNNITARRASVPGRLFSAARPTSRVAATSTTAARRPVALAVTVEVLGARVRARRRPVSIPHGVLVGRDASVAVSIARSDVLRVFHGCRPSRRTSRAAMVFIKNALACLPIPNLRCLRHVNVPCGGESRGYRS